MRTLLGSGLLLLVLGSQANAASPWIAETVVRGNPVRAIHGLSFGPDGALYAGSVLGQSIHRVDTGSGEVSVHVPPSAGLADDLEFAPDGTVYWTDFAQGRLMMKSPRQGPRAIASGLPGLNSLALAPTGRLFASQVFAADALWEFDPTGTAPPRKVVSDMGGLNGFDVGPDGRLCGPLWFRAQVVCIDVDSGSIDVVADGFRVPAAANFDSKGQLFAIDNETGGIYRIDINTKSRTLVATAPSNLDNLAFDAADNLFVTNMSDNAIYGVDLDSGRVRTLISSPLTMPVGLAFANERLYIADTFTLSMLAPGSAEPSDLSRSLQAIGMATLVAASPARIAVAGSASGSVVLRSQDFSREIARWSELAAPSALAFDGTDGVIVAESGSGRLLRLDARYPSRRTVLAEGLAGPGGLAYRNGVWFVSETTAGRICALDTRGNLRVVIGGLLRPEGIAFLPDGRLATAESGRGRVLLVDPASGASEVIATGLPISSPVANNALQGRFPTGLATAPDGSIYLASAREGSIIRLSPHPTP